MGLTAEQIRTYHEQGYVVVPNLFPVEELTAINEDLDRIVEEARKARDVHGGLGSGSLLDLRRRSAVTRQICADERILDCVGDLVFPGIAIYSAKLVSKEPHEDIICHWHQDDAYYTRQSSSARRMSIWLPLQDVTVEQGCLQVVPGSHRWGLKPYFPKKGGSCNLGFDESQLDDSMKVYCPVPAGSMVLFSALLWHHSQGNTTPQRRRAFIVSYQEATVLGGNAAQWEILRSA